MTRIIAILAFVVAASIAAPALAFDTHAGSPPQASVFPTPRDPWRSWGVRNDAPRHVASPRVVTQWPAAESAPVWVPAQWVWDGAAWVWWPGHWVR